MTNEKSKDIGFIRNYLLTVPQWVILSLCLVCLLGAVFFDFVPDKHESEKLFITFNKHQRETVFINCSLEKTTAKVQLQLN